MMNLDKIKLSFNDKSFNRKCVELYKEYGVLIITDVFGNEECDHHMNNIVSYFEKLGTGIDRNNIKETWNDYNLPPQTRGGLFQTLVSNIPTVWEIRNHEKVKKIFNLLYSKLRNKKYNKYIVSNDGINIIPNQVGPFDSKKRKDWPHVDQTIKGEPLKCIQGQAVLTNTTACFRATVGSYHLFDEILDLLKVDEKDKSNWLKFNDDTVKNFVEKNGYEWQTPILSPKGSFIVWSSTTIHSARYALHKEVEDKKDYWKGWRGVVYVSYRPIDEFNKGQLARRAKIVPENRTTNHWSTKMFPKTPGGRYLYVKKRHDIIERMLKEPTLVYEKTGINTSQILDEELCSGIIAIRKMRKVFDV
jgi:hypothetical protein